MTKRKPVDEARFAWVTADGKVYVADKKLTLAQVKASCRSDEIVVRVRVTEVVKKRRKKR